MIRLPSEVMQPMAVTSLQTRIKIMAVELLEKCLQEFIVPRPNMIVRDKKSGKYGKVEFFQWKGGDTTKIPIQFEDGTRDDVYVTAFNYRYDVLEPESDVYRKHLHQSSVQKELKLKQAKLGEVINIIHKLESNRREIHSLPLRQALDIQINDLKDYMNELMRDIAKLRKE